ncbi:bifunctional lysylphosphatidylglycerol flippase/synthetase MprF [Fodinibius salsisoli]|uniref:Phosphatidylglycerol lysyltransferase n=1 Tax=Fodinibius salsisoli TaxID=2820877 RepID=A0ABT3PKR6_9BACT|nr:bifunctional lysylphosphatidylglycerol flippase/synthetase MprF [Fodinibius salsisoli]MCW9706522.1 bifunctional lysylphosphatidylglycerol flippase/synthetase MprF [Fodinibius salsisoli]
MKKALKKFTPFISIIFFGFALWFLDQELQQYQLTEVTAQLSEIPNIYIAVSLFLSFLSYVVLTAYDALGVEYIGEELEAGKIIRAGYVGYAFSHNIGLALITGGSIRYRIYSAWGFTGMQVTQIVGFSAFTLWIGFCAVGGLALLFATPNLPNDFALPFVSLRVLGIILLLMVVGYIWASAKIKRELTFKDWSFQFPELRLSLQQVTIASVDWLMAASVLYVLLPDVGINFFSFVGIFLLAQIAGLFSQVPGGLGVFESVMLLYLSNFMPGSQVLGILVVYRLIYYILPLLVAIIVLGYQEYQVNRKAVHEFGEKAADWVPRVVPQVLSFSVFIGGAILLFSGALPSEVPRMYWLQHFIPLPVIEMSHFLASLVGAALLVLAGALQRRVDAAYHLTVGLLIFGILFSLLKGADYEEASILAVMLIALLFCRQEFHRKASLFSQQYSRRWLTMIFMVLISAVWLGAFAYQHVEYQRNLWWEFTLMGDAPRYLRATVAALGFAVIIGLVKLLRPNKQKRRVAENDVERSKKVIMNADHALSNLALLGDKQFLFSDSGESFIMFRIENRSCIALGDPVGKKEEAESLIWAFYEYCLDQDLNPVFYDVGNKYLEYYMDLELPSFKIGEEGKVNLTAFDLERLDPSIQTNCTYLENQGYEWKLLAPGEAAPFLPTLKQISSESLRSQKRKEAGFSVGNFDEQYLQHFPIAMVEKEGVPVAFSNILSSGGRQEITTDLLRYRSGVPHGVIDFMVAQTMKWGAEQGYQRFNLGLAPLSGSNEQQFSSRWGRLINFVYTYGENIYGFKTVRSYKEKYRPDWQPKYLVCPAGLAMPGILSSLAKVVGGGLSTPVSTKMDSLSPEAESQG